MSEEEKYQISYHDSDRCYYVYETPKSCRLCGHSSALMSRVRIGLADLGFKSHDETIEWLHNLGVDDSRIIQ